MDSKWILAAICFSLMCLNQLGYFGAYELKSIEEAIIIVGGKYPGKFPYGITNQSDIWGLNFMDTSSKLNTYYYCDVPEYPVLVYGTASTLFNNSLVCNYLLSHSKRFSPDTHFHSLLERSESLFFPVICGGNLGDLEIPGLVIAIDHCYILLNQRDGHDIRFPYDLKWKMLGTMKEQRALASMAPINETHFWITGGREDYNKYTAKYIGKSKKTTEIFNFLNFKFERYAFMEEPLQEHAMLQLNSTVTFLIGGRTAETVVEYTKIKSDTPKIKSDESNSTSKTWFFDHNSKFWSLGPSLMEERFGHTASIIFADKGYPEEKKGIVVIGGCKTPKICLASVEIFWGEDWLTGKWEPGPDLPNPIIGHKAIETKNGDVIVTGGKENILGTNWRIGGIEHILGGTWSRSLLKLVCAQYENATTPKCLWTKIPGGGPPRENHIAAPFPEEFCTIDGPEFAESFWRHINMVAFILYFLDCLYKNDFHSIIQSFFSLPMLFVVPEFHMRCTNDSSCLDFNISLKLWGKDYLWLGGVALHFVISCTKKFLFDFNNVLKNSRRKIPRRNKRNQAREQQQDVFIFLSSLLPRSLIDGFFGWIKYWVIDFPILLPSLIGNLLHQIMQTLWKTFQLIYEKILSILESIYLHAYEIRRKWISSTSCKLKKHSDGFYELICDTEIFRPLHSQDFIKYMVEILIEDLQTVHGVEIYGKRRIDTIRHLSKYCEKKIFGKPKDIRKRFETTAKFGQTLDTGSDIKIELPSQHLGVDFKVFIKNSIESDFLCKFLTFQNVWILHQRRENLNEDVLKSDSNEENIVEVSESDSKIVGRLEDFCNYFKEEKYMKAAQICVDARKEVENIAELVIIEYCNSMALLHSKDLKNVEHGYHDLKEIFDSGWVKDWKSEFPAIYYGLGKYELSLNDEFVFIKEDLDKELEPMSILCHRKLKEIFPEMDFEDLQQRLMSNLRYSVKDKVATCRYSLCRETFDKSAKGILNWKSNIRIGDVDFKGFTRMTCTDKCFIEFHPRCWKHKKEAENFGLDKNYLTTYCPTPECTAPIYEVAIFKCDLENPIRFVDEDITKDMLKSLTLQGSQKPKTKEKDIIGKKLPVEQNSNMKDLQRKLRKLQKEIEAKKRETEELKSNNKKLVIENRNLNESHIQQDLDLKMQNQQLIENMEAKKDKVKMDNIKSNEIFWKARINEYRNLQTFSNIMSYVWPESKTLPFASERLNLQIENAKRNFDDVNIVTNNVMYNATLSHWRKNLAIGGFIETVKELEHKTDEESQRQKELQLDEDIDDVEIQEMVQSLQK